MDDDYDDLVCSVRCPVCDGDVFVDHGMTLGEALWMHEYECPAIRLGIDGQIIAAA